jgi:tRNA nucleotidyltransferase (CCA-adding enzyme)
MVSRNPLEALRSSPGGVRLLEALAAVDTPGYLVGGAVRDLLLGRVPRELDVVVEGDVGPLAAALGGEVTRHERFGTATVRVDDLAYDLAQARTERYPAPGALPDVAPATLAEDLLRRDVTVNAIALSATGEVVAVERALDDLESGTLRVLHDASFQDDPTRLWRLARYGARLGFTPAAHTDQLAREAVQNGALSTVSGPRIGNELRLALREPDPHAALAAADALGLLYPGMDPDPHAAAAAALLPQDGRPDLLALGAWAGEAPIASLDQWLDELAFTAEDRERIVATATAPERLTFPARASDLAAALRSEPLEAVALAGAAGDGDAARRWLDDLRSVRLAINGQDLMAAGIPAGPAVGVRLRRALDAALDGAAPDRERQLEVALSGTDEDEHG